MATFPPPDARRFKGKRLLVIDGHMMQLRLHCDILRAAGFEVIPITVGESKPQSVDEGEVPRAFNSLQQMERYVETLNFDAVVTGKSLIDDGESDAVDGNAVAAAVQQSKPGTPVVMQSLYYDPKMYPDAAESMARDLPAFKAVGGRDLFAKGDYAGICDALEAAFAKTPRR